MHQEVLATVQYEDLRGDIAEVAEECGIDVAVDLAVKFGGATISVPKSALIRTAERFILEHHDGTNVSLLARKTGLSERQVYRILKGGGAKNPNQLGLFEEEGLHHGGTE